MIEKHVRKLTPTKLRLVLFCMIGLILIVCSVGFWLYHERMVEYAAQINADNVAATTSSEDIATLQRLEKELQENEVAVTRAKSIVADSQFYQYQNQIMKDINAYARDAGVTVIGYMFDSADGSASGGQAQPADSEASAALTVPGLKTTSVSISLKNPVRYKSFMKFLRAIELNLTKMEVKGVSILKDQKDHDIRVNPIQIEVYTR